MPRHDLHNSIKVARAFDPRSITSDTTTVGTEIDLAGYETCEFAIAYGALADTDIVPELTECATSGGTFTAVADGDLLGTEAEAGTTQAAASVTKKLGYRGSKRYVKLTMVTTSTTGANLVGALAVLGGKSNMRVEPDGAVPG